MPAPIYHVGSGLFLGATLGRRLDPWILMAGTLVVDLEVPIYHWLDRGLETPRYGNTLLVGGAGGVVCGLLLWWAWPLARRTIRQRLPERRSLPVALLSGLLGAWLHVLLDGMYRTGAGLLWPSALENPLCRFERRDAELTCLVLTGVALVLLLWRARRRTGAAE